MPVDGHAKGTTMGPSKQKTSPGRIVRSRESCQVVSVRRSPFQRLAAAPVCTVAKDMSMLAST